ncbi:unnamed protein product [Scytosiphon promiscuus]
MSLTERTALLALFSSTDGTRWTRNDQWGTDAPLSHWYGVNVSQQGRVVMISLHNNNLRGPIPEALRVLSKLKTLRLYNNLISGHIPPELGDLAVLEELNLSWNQLGGEIPTTLGKLGNLKWLSLGDNKLRGTIPKELAALKKVEAFWINDNRLTGLLDPGPFHLGFFHLGSFRLSHLRKGLLRAAPFRTNFDTGHLCPNPLYRGHARTGLFYRPPLRTEPRYNCSSYTSYTGYTSPVYTGPFRTSQGGS